MPDPLRIVVADPSPLTLKILRDFLTGLPGLEMVGAARSGRELRQQLSELHPDVLCLSAVFGGAETLDLVREIMASWPLPILILSAEPSPQRDQEQSQLLQAGAVEMWRKPQAPLSLDTPPGAELVAKINRLSRVPIISRPRNRHESASPRRALFLAPEKPTMPDLGSRLAVSSSLCKRPQIVAVGASTGGPQTLLTVFSGLPPTFGVPILCVQHISKGFLTELVKWLDGLCPFAVCIASEGEIPLPGHIYFPEEDTHLELDSRGRMRLSRAEPLGGHRPAVTTLFQSVARAHGESAVAVLLTGMGSDGALGLHAVREAGGTTIAQNEASCVVFGMPKQAIALGAAQFVMSPPEITRKLTALIR